MGSSSVAMCARKRRDHVCRWPVAYGINKNKWFRTLSCGSSKARTKKNVFFFCLASEAKYRAAFNKKKLDSANESSENGTKNMNGSTTTRCMQRKRRERKTKQNKTLRQMKAYIGQRVIKRCINVSLIRWKIYDKSFSVDFFSLFVRWAVYTISVGNLSASPTNSFSLFWHVCLFYFCCTMHDRLMVVVCVCVHSNENLKPLEETRIKTCSACAVIDLEINSINIESVSVDWNGNHICLCSVALK